MSGWTQRDAEAKEDEREWVENLGRCLEEIDNFLLVNWIAPPFKLTPEGYRKALQELCYAEQGIGVYFEHQRLIKLNEDFYGPAFKEESVEPL